VQGGLVELQAGNLSLVSVDINQQLPGYLRFQIFLAFWLSSKFLTILSVSLSL